MFSLVSHFLTFRIVFVAFELKELLYVDSISLLRLHVDLSMLCRGWGYCQSIGSFVANIMMRRYISPLSHDNHSILHE